MTFLRSLTQLFQRTAAKPARRRPTRSPRPFKPQIESLEERCLLSTWTVTTLADSGSGSLRDQLAQAKSGDTIQFTPGLVGSIPLQTGLTINQNVTIDGL